MSRPRIGVASVMQETNTFSPAVSTVANFEAQGILDDERLMELVGTNTEAGGALSRLASWPPTRFRSSERGRWPAR